ncbi:MAG: DNA (cytosine-5-)-methyltransferase [Acidobacteriia bacterium]|nr:DNA (cytosine-5-)-methyltransferase [Terriglobia bacterium]
MRKIRTISLFVGCGGSDYALNQTGFDIVWANDIWDLACKTYRDNIPAAKVEEGDITSYSQFPSADFLAGCYPCQGFTQGGRREWGDSINYLYREFDRVLRLVLPKVFVVENVNGMAYGVNKDLLNNQLRRYRSAGYRVHWKVLNARDYGVAQFRRRVFLVGVRSDISFEYSFPRPTHGVVGGDKFLTQKDAIAGLSRSARGKYDTEPLHWYYLSRKRRHDWDETAPCIVGHWRHVPLHPSSPPLRRVHTDKWEFVREGPARRLSYLECAALQGFPRTFTWRHGTPRDKFQMIGNAVPPPLFQAVVKQLDGLW